MEQICNDLHQLEKHIIDLETKYKWEYKQSCAELSNYIERRNIAYEEVGQDLLKIINNHPRLCSICSKPMDEGYCIENGMEYYCSDECLHEVYDDEEWQLMYEDGNGDSYWSEWND